MTEIESIRSIFQRKLITSDKEQKLRLLSIFAHGITVEIRGAFITEDSYEKTIILTLNEIQHQITARIMNLLHNEDEWNEEEFVSRLYDDANEGRCKSGIDFTIQQTLNSVNW